MPSASQLGFAAESTVGTPVTVTRFVEFNSESIKSARTKAQSKGLRGGYLPNRSKTVAENIGGPITMELAQVEHGLWWKHLLGSAATVDADPEYTHTFTPGSATGLGLTLQIGREDNAGTVRPFTYGGCALAGATITVPETDYATVAWDVVAMNVTTGTALATAALNADYNPFASCDAVWAIDASGVNVKSGTIQIARPKDLRFRQRAATPTDSLAPIDSGGLASIDVTGTVVLDFESLTYYNLFANDSDSALTLTLTGDTIASNPFKLTFAMTVKWTGETPVVAGTNALEQPMPFHVEVAAGDADDDAFSIELVTSDATP